MTAVLVLMSTWGLLADDRPTLLRLPSVEEIADLDQSIDAHDTVTADVRWGLHLSTIGQSGSQGLAMVDVRATRAGDRVELPGTSSFRWAVGGGVHFWSGLDDALLPNTLYDLDVDVSFVLWEHERGAVSLGVTPGLYGDMQFVDSSTFQVTGWVNATLDLGERWTLVGGVAVVRQLESRWLPLGGVIWRPAPEWQVDFVFPRPRLARQIAQTDDGDAWLYLAGQFGGGAWSIDDPIVGPAVIRYSDLRLLAGLNLWRTSGRELSLEAGYVFSREVAIDELIVSNPSDSWIAQLSWAF